MTLRESVLNLLFPAKCPFCGRVEDRPGICPACQAALPRVPEGEQEQTLSAGVRCASPLYYENCARDGILRFKFHGASSAAEEFGPWIAACAAQHFSGEFDVVTWVPVSARRLRQRGYDQAQLLAQSACRVWDVQPEALLRKITDNPAQSGLQEASARRANVLGVYTAERSRVAGRNVLVVDDIVTTGSTLRECARTLQEAGAAGIVCATLAQTR